MSVDGAAPRPTHRLGEVHATFGEDPPAGEGSGTEVVVGGRLVLTRRHGRLAFLVLREGDDELQLFCRRDVLGADGMDALEEVVAGDWLVAAGEVVRTRKGELSVEPTLVEVVGRGAEPLPDKWHGLKDTEARLRRRWVDLAVNAESRRVFSVRAAVIRALRSTLDARGYVEVETPMLHPLPGGASARPFRTHHNALDLELYLRIAPELYLKRLVAGGMTRVYELGRVFRNEGLSPRHNPEFTILESYEAFADYRDIMDLTEELVRSAARAAIGTTRTPATSAHPEGIELADAWPRRTLLDLVAEATGVADLGYDTDRARVAALCAAHDVPVEPGWGVGKLLLELYEKLVEPSIVAPTFVTDYPVEVSPLARRSTENPAVTERFELIIGGREHANAFSELTDPAEQRARFEAQVAARAAGDDEAMLLDEDYLEAMSFGMPPMGGLGIGVDRVVMLLAGVESIRDVILFPTLRPRR